jgi:hypothetical protein
MTVSAKDFIVANSNQRQTVMVKEADFEFVIGGGNSIAMGTFGADITNPDVSDWNDFCTGIVAR